VENINYFDLIVFTLVTLLGLKGLLRGFIKEFFALVGLVGGVFIASRFSSYTGELIDTVIPITDNNTLILVGFIVALILFWILAYIVGALLSTVFSMSGLGIFDKFFGFVFGAGKIFLLFSIIIYAVSQIDIINDKLIDSTKGSIAYPLLKSAGEYIIKLDTAKMQSSISNGIDNAIDTSKEVISDVAKETINNEMSK
jgi:membrane protein required for colicin V production